VRTHKDFLTFLDEKTLLLDVGQIREGEKERRREGGKEVRR